MPDIILSSQLAAAAVLLLLADRPCCSSWKGDQVFKVSFYSIRSVYEDCDYRKDSWRMRLLQTIRVITQDVQRYLSLLSRALVAPSLVFVRFQGPPKFLKQPPASLLQRVAHALNRERAPSSPPADLHRLHRPFHTVLYRFLVGPQIARATRDIQA